MSIIDELNLQLSPEDRQVIEKTLKDVWNTAIERASDVAVRSYYEDEGGFEAMDPKKIGEQILELKKQ